MFSLIKKYCESNSFFPLKCTTISNTKTPETESILIPFWIALSDKKVQKLGQYPTLIYPRWCVLVAFERISPHWQLLCGHFSLNVLILSKKFTDRLGVSYQTDPVLAGERCQRKLKKMRRTNLPSPHNLTLSLVYLSKQRLWAVPGCLGTHKGPLCFLAGGRFEAWQ